MKENPVSVKTKKINYLNTRVQNFQTFYKESESRMRSTTSLHNLADKLYSNTFNKQFKDFSSPKKNQKRPNSSNKQNPQSNNAMMGLEMRVEHMGTYAEINTKLLQEKKNLEKLISNLKEKITQQKKKLSQSQYNLKKNTNEKDNNMTAFKQAHERSLKLQQNIFITQNDIRNLKNQKNNINNKINNTQDNFMKQSQNCKNIEENIRKLKVSLLQEEKNKTLAKADLAKELRVMNCASIHTKQLEEERANVLVEINKFVKESQIQVGK